MRFGRDILLLAAYLCIMAGPAAACDVGAATAAVGAIGQKILSRQVKRIELSKISDRLLASIPISPERFATYSSERKTLTLTERDATELAAAVKALAPAQLSYQPDLRWQLVLLDETGNKLHTIFFSKRYVQGRGRAGYVDGDMCSFSTATIGSPALVKWLQKRL
ncbi:hypothetical protein C2U70_25610 [Bradyrhizobium guangdongense]|uniref:hypothetical protein n=1 Tax=Bradyrhizobium guangdongense TaxID=1325090 RepID=UPI00112C7A1C|nr:hypothetical protein [Bradyrhizobium guangdongense]TPQ30819.1 hypothetical protein C2U70_25610 [Bradyrhizobium guangdongense]